jgi:hypothetical protein
MFTKLKTRRLRGPIMERELLARFGPTEYEDYNEALSRVKQKGTLREYQSRSSKNWPTVWVDGHEKH